MNSRQLHSSFGDSETDSHGDLSLPSKQSTYTGAVLQYQNPQVHPGKEIQKCWSSQVLWCWLSPPADAKG